MKHGLDQAQHGTDDPDGRTVPPHGFKYPGGMFIALLLDIDVRFQQHTDILCGDPIDNHAEPLTGKVVFLLLGLIFKGKQPLLARKDGP